MEIWKDILGYEGYYQVSNLGNVKSLDRVRETLPTAKKQFKTFNEGRVLIPKESNRGYLRYALTKEGKTKYLSAHRLVAQSFIPNIKDKPDVNHINGIKTDNRIENLEWCTGSENIKHNYVLGIMNQKGDKNNCAILTIEQVKEIKVKLLNGITPRQISEQYPIHRTSVYDIKKGRNWNHVFLDNF